MKWTQVAYGAGLPSVLVLPVSGVYIVVRVERVHGIAMKREWLYVGQSLNLRRRYAEHTDFREPNPALNAARREYSYEFWWTSLPRERLDEVEADLIDALSPSANRRRGARCKTSRVPVEDQTLPA